MASNIISLALFLLVMILTIIIFKEKKHKGTIYWSKDENGTNIWNFKFKNGITYEALENEKYITFKVIKKGDNDEIQV